ncbi:Fanconi anemia group D2 protein isoform X2 [Callorhinchus milii]|uniref:Fanconi anemia group D2 protein isoform X2 n=1 Tax=Callorhinchus milii TaxID=7868 RepID=UPI00045743D7|nr:Fanconi anemia group D2 protein isoform X2 [Callorhinchus milii]|eukprot:gi/632946291/ref/XP_007888485.1/ PREDICTED: Fanconi anemia group D2 protein isoform X2 [Callorhinchus milii]
MVAKRRLSKSVEEQRDPGAKAISRAKKSKIDGRKPSPSAQEGEVEDNTVFVQLLKASGVILKSGNLPNELTLDQAVFQKKLFQGLRKHPHYPNVLQEFISGLESHIEDRDKFRNCLLACGLSQMGESSNAGTSYQESLIKLLLGIEVLQPPVMNTLFEKIPEFIYDNAPEDGINMPRLIINQFKWLDRIVDSKEMTSKIMQLISVAPLEIQRDIITSLPEILEDAQHNEIGKELNLLLQQNTQLTVPILDALSSLNLRTELLAEVRQSVMSTLSAVNLEDLPVVIKFILHAITAADAVELQPSQSQQTCRNPGGTSINQVKHDCVGIMFDVIKVSVRFQKTTAEAWIKAIEKVDSAAEHKVIDLLVLLILHTTNTNNSKKQVEKLLRNKVRLGNIRNQLLQVAFKSHATVVREYFPTILSLAQTLLRSTDPSVVSFACEMYKLAFRTFDSYCQQEVVGALVTHVCSGFTAEADVSLDALLDLVSHSLSAMAVYAVFVKGILDYMDNLSIQQIRKLFYILSSLAFSKGQEGSHIQDDMHIVIRKQLSSTISKYKRIGIIGAVMMIGSLAYNRSKAEEASSNSATMSKESLRQATALLELVRGCSEHSPEAAALYYDELANLVQKGNLDPQVQELIGRSVLDDFQEDFVVDQGPVMEGKYVLPLMVMYNLDEEESEGGIVINLLPLLSEMLTNGWERAPVKHGTKKGISPVCLASFFRLLRFCEEVQHNGNLEEIDALLGCPLYMTNDEMVEKLESLSKQERELLCSLQFHALNWFREVVNAFCKQQDPEMKGKVLLRLQNITQLQTSLEKCLAATPGYSPPLACFDCEVSDVTPFIAPAAPAKKGKKGRKVKKRTKSDSNKSSSTDSSQTEEPMEESHIQAEQTQEKDNAEEGKVSINLSNYRAYFRELDISVFTILRCGLVTKSLLDTEQNTKVTEVVQLGSAELMFLLEDLSRKLEYILIATATRKINFLKVKADRDVGFSHLRQNTPLEMARFAVHLLDAFCNHLENIHNYFQVMMGENNGVVDALGVNVKEHQLMSTCYQLLLQILHTLFVWSGFSQHENSKLLKEALGVLTARLKPGDLELEELFRQTFRYLQNIQSSVPSCLSAVTLTQLLIVIAKRSPDDKYKEQIALIARGFLCQSWILPTGEREKGIKYNEALQNLLCIYLEHTEDVLQSVEEIAGVGVPELLNSSKDGSSATFPTLTRQTFLIFYRVMMRELEKSVKCIPAGMPSDSSEVQAEKLLRWNLAVRDFHILVNLVKVFDTRPVLGICLKHGRFFLESFVKQGMPLLDYSFKKHRDDVQSLLKTLQLSTRQMHHMCGHTKINQDTSLTNHVPPMKRLLELFVYRVKAMLTINKCQEAFWLGNLKNRDLQGEEIQSQLSQQESERDEQSQVPEDDAEEEEEEDSEPDTNKSTKNGGSTEDSDND